jgi:hypothetical protein
VSGVDVRVPEVLPLLGRGRHRTPNKGACFMELASYLAGERWSDHPACSHPLLAALARSVNDRTSDAARPRLAVLVPAVIGLTGDDVRIDARIGLLCASRALPVAEPSRRRPLSVAVLACARVLADAGEGDDAEVVEALAAARIASPGAAAWVERMTAGRRVSTRGFRRESAPHIVRTAVDAIAESPLVDADVVLHDLLVDAVAVCRAMVADARPADVDADRWAAVCRLTGAGEAGASS